MASEGDLNHVALTTSLNQTGDLMVSTLPNGFAVMDSFPRKLRFHRQGVGHLKAVKLKGTSNLVAFVKRDEPRSVVLFDQRRERPIGELTTSDTDNVDAFDWGDRIIATISRAGAVAVYDLSDLRLEHTFASAHAHADEVLAVNTSTVAYPDAVIGSIRIYDSATATTKTIRAHEHAIACSCLSPDGKKLATASTKGEYRPRLVRSRARISHSRLAPRASLARYGHSDTQCTCRRQGESRGTPEELVAGARTRHRNVPRLSPFPVGAVERLWYVARV